MQGDIKQHENTACGFKCTDLSSHVNALSAHTQVHISVLESISLKDLGEDEIPGAGTGAATKPPTLCNSGQSWARGPAAVRGTLLSDQCSHPEPTPTTAAGEAVCHRTAGQSCVLVAVRAQPPQQIRAATARAPLLTCCKEQRLPAPCLREEGSTKLTELNACRLLQQATGIFLQLARKPCLKSLCIQNFPLTHTQKKASLDLWHTQVKFLNLIRGTQHKFQSVKLISKR